MRILITGGMGFIGSHLADAYLKKGDTVYVIDNLTTGSLSNIKHLRQNPLYDDRFFTIVEDILNYEKMEDLISRVDMVIHLAAAVGVQYIIDNPISSIITNVRGTEIVLEIANKYQKKVLITSTSEVYGKHTHAPLRETDDCVYGPSSRFRWSYAAGKFIDEFTALAYHKEKGLPVVVIRLFNTVGPRQTGRYGMVIPRFVKQALSGAPITVYGDGTQTRTFTHVKDVVKAIMLLMKENRAEGEVVNIGGREEISILSLAKKIKEMTESSSEIKFVPYDVAYPKDFEDMQRRVPSLEKLKSLIGYTPDTPLDDILYDVIEYFKRWEGIAW